MRQSKFHRDIPNNMKIISALSIKGGTKLQQEIAEKVVKWCCNHFQLDDAVIRLHLRAYEDCWGYCVEGNTKHSYNIMIAHDQSVRDFVATIVHELVHVMQWETEEWVGDGESECNRMQYMLTDELWKKGVL
tara:strand:+ start:128 stop:523 length:396 start_codon:yes stop_codon:yes gene_type:complete